MLACSKRHALTPVTAQLINHTGDVKVSDFGIVRELDPSDDDKASTFVGTLNYMSPERVSGGTYSYASDIWSFGLSLVTCALGRYPIDYTGTCHWRTHAPSLAPSPRGRPRRRGVLGPTERAAGEATAVAAARRVQRGVLRLR